MRQGNRHQLPELIKLFDFLDLETPNARDWVRGYLTRKAILLSEPTPNMQSLKVALASHFMARFTDIDVIKNFSKTMGSAWRVMKHRKEKGIGNLSVSLDKAVLTQLKTMCKGKKKAKIVSLLIEDGYKAFLESDREIKKKLADNRRIKNSELNKIRLLDLQGKINPKESVAYKNLQAKNDDLRHCIATLYDLIYSANERGNSIDDALLIEATKVYYSVFSETNNQ